MASETDITTKKYRKLVMKVSQTGFSFCCIDTITHRVTLLKEISFEKFVKGNTTDYYWNAFVDNPELTRQYDDFLILHENNLNTFVPKALFDEDYLGSYLQYNTQVFETDFFDFDEISGYDMCNVYIPYVNINNFLIDQFGSFTYKGANSVLVKSLLDLSRNIEEKQVYAHFSEKHFELVVTQNQKLILYNSFNYSVKEDFLYFLLFTAEQLALNPETFKLHLLGRISENDEYFKMAYKYVRHVQMLDVSDIASRTGLTDDECRKHFILLQP